MRLNARTKAVIGGITCILFGIFTLIGLFKDVTSWQIFHPGKTEVEAVVTRVKETVNPRGNNRYGNRYSYDLYVDYEINGKKYKEVLVADKVTRHSPVEVGTTMNLTIDPKFPRKILINPDWWTYLWGVLSFTSFFLGICILKSYKRISDRE